MKRQTETVTYKKSTELLVREVLGSNFYYCGCYINRYDGWWRFWRVIAYIDKDNKRVKIYEHEYADKIVSLFSGYEVILDLLPYISSEGGG